MKIDTVQVIARLFGRDRKPCGIDHIADISRCDGEAARHVTGGNSGKIFNRQGWQTEIGPAGADHCMTVGNIDLNLGAFGQLARDVIEQMRRNGGRASRANSAFCLRGNIHIHVGCGHRQHTAVGLQHDIGENRYGVAALNNRLHVAKRPQEADSIDGQFHWLSLLFCPFLPVAYDLFQSTPSADCGIATPPVTTHHKI